MTSAIRACLAVLALIVATLPARAFDTAARAAYVLDLGTGTVLLNKDADTPRPPASMSKLMTLYVAFEAIRDGRLKMTETLPVSRHAMSYGGSTLFLQEGERVRVEDLIRGIIVLSGNDACVVIAEALSPDGTEEGFARLLTRRARELGMKNSTFANSNGWPAPGHLMSVHDLAILAERLIKDFPEFYPMFAQTEFLFDEKESQNRFNRNPLLTLNIGADGLKTGHTKEAGYGLVGSAKQGDRRVIFVISGLETAKQRAREAEAIVNWSFRQFGEKTLARAGEAIAKTPVWMGSEPQVNLVLPEDMTVLLPASMGNTLSAEVVYPSPVEAPVTKGQVLGELVLQLEGLPERRVPLVADRDVAKGGFVARVSTVARLLLTRYVNLPEGAM